MNQVKAILENLQSVLEYNRPKTEQHIGALLLAETKRRAAQPVYRDSPPAEFRRIEELSEERGINLTLDELEKLDPTSKKKFMPYIINLYLTGQPVFFKAPGMMDMNLLLSLYQDLLANNIIDGRERDIMQYKTVAVLSMFVQSKHDAGERKKIAGAGNAETVFENDAVRVIAVYDYDAACKYGGNTKWCITQKIGGKGIFERYFELGNIYIIIPKEPEYTGEKYALAKKESLRNELDDIVPDSLAQKILTTKYDVNILDIIKQHEATGKRSAIQ